MTEITGTGHRATGVRLADGSVIEADAVVAGVGITPSTQLARAAGLRVDNRVLVDEHLATTDPGIAAAEDVASAYYPNLGTHLRLEHWSAARNQGPVAAATMLGRDATYDRVPYFFSDQYEMGMEYSGYIEHGIYEEVFFKLALNDLRRAADLFAPVHERSAGVDGWVSLEVSPLLARDTKATIAQAVALHAKAGRPNVLIKIPGTAEGRPLLRSAPSPGCPST